MSVLKAAIAPFVLIAGFSVALAQPAPPERAAAANLTKRAIIGVWRLAGIDYSGPNGALADPVFGPNRQGILIYDQSGWMSVQIVTANRPVIAKPAARTARVATPDDAKLAAVAFDTYYAYFGTWDFNADTSVITHHINSSLLPYETGLEYGQEAVLDGVQLKLIARSQDMGEERHRTLVWTRISDPVLIALPPVSVADSAPPTPAREQATKYGNMPADYKQAIQKYFLEHMKYPDSVRYQEITKPEQGYTTAVTGGFFMREKRDYGWTVRATINAKNSSGSYVGFKTYTFLFRGEMIVDARLPLPGDEMNEPTRN
jgi:hypothetical protein